MPLKYAYKKLCYVTTCDSGAYQSGHFLYVKCPLSTELHIKLVLQRLHAYKTANKKMQAF